MNKWVLVLLMCGCAMAAAGPANALGAPMASATSSLVSWLLGLDTITSVSPGNVSVIYLDPGQEQEFTVTVQRSVFMQPYNYNDEWRLNNIYGSSNRCTESHKFSRPESGNYLKTCYCPDELSPGSYQVLYFRETYFPLGMYLEPYLQLPRTEWRVVVRGVEVLPELTMSAPPGLTIRYSATAYPSGIYTYRWYLDGDQVHTGRNFSFTPTPAQIGPHTLEVTATSWLGKTYTYAREITVPFATIEQGQMTSMERTPDGGYLVAGRTDRTDIPGEPSHGGFDAYVMRYDAQGALLWQKLLGGSMYDSFLSVESTSDGGCVLAGLSNSGDIEGLTGSGGYDIFAARLDGEGNVLWQKLLGGAWADYGHAVISAGEGGFFLAGKSDYCYQQGSDYGARSYVARLDGQGTVLWEKRLGSAISDTGSDLLVAPDGELVIAGLYEGFCGMFKVRASDGSGELIWEADIGHELLKLCPSHGGGYVGIGKVSHHQTGWNAYAAEVDDDGNVLWENLFDDLSYSSPAAVMKRPGGGYVIASGVSTRGSYQQTERFGSLVTLGADGAFLRQHLIGEIYWGAQLKDALLTGSDICMALVETYAEGYTAYLVAVGLSD